MAVHTHTLNRPSMVQEFQSSDHICRYYVVDTEGEKPSDGLNYGDLCFVISTTSFYKSVTSSGWSDVSGSSSVVYAPTGGNYVTFSVDSNLSNERTLTAGSSITIATDSTKVYINALTGGVSGSVYASTGGPYITYSGGGDLTNERILTAGSSITIVTDATSVYINALTGGGGGTVVNSAVPLFLGTTSVWLNHPAALTELFGSTAYRTQFDLTNVTSCRLATCLSVAGSGGSAFLFARVSTDGGTTWASLGSTVTGPAVSIGSAVLVQTSPWVTIRTGYNRDVILSVWGSGGNGALDPSFGNVTLNLK